MQNPLYSKSPGESVQAGLHIMLSITHPGHASQTRQ